MFRGNHPARIDEKGRLKRRAEEVYGAQFYITSSDGKRAEIYPLKEWEEIEKRMAAIPKFNEAKRKYLDITNYFGQVAEMDAQGRVLIPQLLREAASLQGDVVVLGTQTYLEIVNHDGFKKQMESNPLTQDDKNALADLGL
jgi:MraZ protein